MKDIFKVPVENNHEPKIIWHETTFQEENQNKDIIKPKPGDLSDKSHHYESS